MIRSAMISTKSLKSLPKKCCIYFIQGGRKVPGHYTCILGGRKVPGHYTCIFNKTQYFLMKHTETYIFNKKENFIRNKAENN